MPTEFCRDCADRHHGRSCRYSRCRAHCTCTTQEQRAWREYLDTYPTTVRSRCLTPNCGQQTTHACAQYNTQGLRIVGRYCGEHCRRCDVTHCQLGATIPVQCSNCGRPAVYHINIDERIYCHRCANTVVCHACAAIHTREVRGVCARCGTCRSVPPDDEDGEPTGCCNCEESRHTTRPALHNPGLFRGFIYGVSGYAGSNKFDLNPLRRSVGVEIEVAGFVKPKRAALADLYNTCQSWHTIIGTDGSLRDPTNKRSSVEIRTSPASGDELVLQLSAVLGSIRAANGIVNSSCGLHVHVNVDDASRYTLNAARTEHLSNLDTFIRVWQYVQDSMYAIVNPGRATVSDYARPWRTGVAHYRTLAEANGRVARYSGLNLEAIGKYNTVEFRLHHGCLNTRMITAWAMLCGMLVEVCVQGHGSDTLIAFAKESPNDFLWALCMNNNMRAYLGYGTDRWTRKRYKELVRKAA